MNPSFLSLCPDDNIKKKAVIPTAEYNRPVICQYTYRVSSVSTLLSELLFQTPEKRVHYTVSQHLYQVLINKLLIFLQLFLPGSHSRAHRPVSSIPLHSDHILHRDALLFLIFPTVHPLSLSILMRTVRIFHKDALRSTVTEDRLTLHRSHVPSAVIFQDFQASDMDEACFC